MEILGIEHPYHPYETEDDLRKEIEKRWEALGIASGLSGEIKEVIRQLYESEHKPLPKGEEVNINDLPIVRRVWAKIDKIDDNE